MDVCVCVRERERPTRRTSLSVEQTSRCSVASPEVGGRFPPRLAGGRWPGAGAGAGGGTHAIRVTGNANLREQHRCVTPEIFRGTIQSPTDVYRGDPQETTSTLTFLRVDSLCLDNSHPYIIIETTHVVAITSTTEVAALTGRIPIAGSEAGRRRRMEVERAEYLHRFVEETDWYNGIVLDALLPGGGAAWRRLPRPLQSWLRNYLGGNILYLASGFLWCFYIYHWKRNVYVPKGLLFLLLGFLLESIWCVKL
ncbi:hypothetical protein BHE74_00040097 [Ensete ventricosum]|nr:hypothetical protein BHE74_00040097 [Ensete ventricosum]